MIGYEQKMGKILFMMNLKMKESAIFIYRFEFLLQSNLMVLKNSNYFVVCATQTIELE